MIGLSVTHRFATGKTFSNVANTHKLGRVVRKIWSWEYSLPQRTENLKSVRLQ